jgi:PIN domain nuclease of toxin-antitoxin system
MVFGEVGNQFGVEGAKILVWGAVGDELKNLDKKRMLAIIQDDPDFYLSVISNMETDILIEKLLKLSEDTGEFMNGEILGKDIEKFIYDINKLDVIFSEATKFLHDSNDMLATGSFVTGEFEQKQAILKTMGRVSEHDGKTQGINSGNVDKPKGIKILQTY